MLLWQFSLCLSTNIEKRYEEIGLRLSQPEAYADMTACARLQKERSQLEPLVETFRAYVQDPSTAKHLTVYGALEGETMVGVLALRAGERHISLFFVDAAWHRRGVGRALFQALLGDTGGAPLTVNSSPYAVEIYRHLGFQATDTEQVRDGIRYTPMQFDEIGKTDI